MCLIWFENCAGCMERDGWWESGVKREGVRTDNCGDMIWIENVWWL